MYKIDIKIITKKVFIFSSFVYKRIYFNIDKLKIIYFYFYEKYVIQINFIIDLFKRKKS